MNKAQEHKTLPSFVTKIDGDMGIVEHTVAVMGNVDLGGDRIHPGAFTKTITERAGQIRVLDAHNSGKVADVLGKPLALWEVGRDQLGPEIKAQFPDATGALMARTQFLMDTPEGRGAFVRIRDGAVDQYSIGYDALDVDFTEEQKDDGPDETVRNLRTIRLWEYSPVAFAMNPATATVSAKEAPPLRVACKIKPKIFECFMDHIETFVREAGQETGSVSGQMVMTDVEMLRESVAPLIKKNWDRASDPAEETKVGRAISAANAGRIRGAIDRAQDKEGDPAEKEKEIGPDGRPVRRIGDFLTGSIHRVFSVIADDLIINGFLTQEQRILMSAAIGDALDALNAKLPQEIMDISLDGTDGYPMFFMGATPPSGQKDKQAKAALATEPEQAATGQEPKAGPNDSSPTRADQLAEIDQLIKTAERELSEEK